MFSMEAMTPISEPTAVRYGFVSARTARLLESHLNGQDIAEKSQEVSAGAMQLVGDLLQAQSFYEAESNAVAPGGEALDAYSCALSIIISQKSEFGIDKFSDLVNFIRALHTSVEALAKGGTGKLDKADAEKAQLFFAHFSRRMLAELNRSKDPSPVLP
jgi:hypothetical protein